MSSELEKSIVGSALWAAAADALGWISELVDERGLMRRTSRKALRVPVPWKRRVGGMNGVEVMLPAGTYSDDTQLRLAICRSIRGDGVFDVEAFAKVELTVWLSYALGAGRGTKTAAANLVKRDVNWFSNQFKGNASYVDAGGNGAAMRIQPHVWAAGPKFERKQYLLSVIRDSVTTHGHMLGLCGAVFHADCLAFSLRTGEVPGPHEWRISIETLDEVYEAIRADPQLSRFWLTAWEGASGRSIETAVSEVRTEALGYLSKVERLVEPTIESYCAALDLLECRGQRLGAGMNTALAASYASWLFASFDIGQALALVANSVGSDTDTIGTMVGALMGATTGGFDDMNWPLQDRDYIEFEARRMVGVSLGRPGDSFAYPDLSSWDPPSTQSDSTGTVEGEVAVRGLGFARPQGEPHVAGGFEWQWLRLDFGQSILCKQRAAKQRPLPKRLLPGPRLATSKRIFKEHAAIGDQAVAPSETIPLFSPPVETKSEATAAADKREHAGGERLPAAKSIDYLSDLAIQSQFDDKTLGALLKEVADGPNGVEKAIAFAAIIAKAISARRKR